MRMSQELKASWRHRIRHVHLPDRAPLYPPRFLPMKLRDHIENQILEQRVHAAGWVPDGANDGDSSSILEREMRSWLERLGPPPTVLSFTRRPTYVLPKHYLAEKEPWEVDFLTKSLKSRLQVSFPPPPQWSSFPWRPSWEAGGEEAHLDHDPLEYSWDPGVMVMPCSEPMYFGPGQITIWPVIDTIDTVQRGKKFRGKDEYERLLEDTTISVLQREYGITAFSIPGSSGVWVESSTPPDEISESLVPDHTLKDGAPKRRENIRRIATVHADVVNDITRSGVSIHVGSPAPKVDAWAWTSDNNPWLPLRQHQQTTSIAAELFYKGSTPHPLDPEQDNLQRPEKKSKYLHTEFQRNSYHKTGLEGMPYSFVAVKPGLRKPAPMGIDNRDLSTAWTYEFARKLGMGRNGVIDHFSQVKWGPANAQWSPSSGISGFAHRSSAYPNLILNHDVNAGDRHVGLVQQPVSQEHALSEPYKQVEVPEIQLLVNGPVTQEIIDSTARIETKDTRLKVGNGANEPPSGVSWPLYYKQLTSVFDNSIKGYPLDSRMSDFLFQEAKAAKMDREAQTFESADQLENGLKKGSQRLFMKRPLSDGLLVKLAKNLRAIRLIIGQSERGGPWEGQVAEMIDQTLELMPSGFVHPQNKAGAPETGDMDQTLGLLRSRLASLQNATGATETMGDDAFQQGPRSETPGGENPRFSSRPERSARLAQASLDDALSLLDSYQDSHHRPRASSRVDQFESKTFPELAPTKRERFRQRRVEELSKRAVPRLSIERQAFEHMPTSQDLRKHRVEASNKSRVPQPPLKRQDPDTYRQMRYEFRRSRWLKEMVVNRSVPRFTIEGQASANTPATQEYSQQRARLMEKDDPLSVLMPQTHDVEGTVMRRIDLVRDEEAGTASDGEQLEEQLRQ